MSQNRKYKPIRTNCSSVNWLGFRINKGSAAGPLLFVFSILLILGCLFGLAFVTIGLIQLLSLMSASQQYNTTEYGTTETQAYTEAYGQTAIALYIVWIVFLISFLILGIYTFNKMKQLRG